MLKLSSRRSSKSTKSVHTNVLEMIHGKKWKALRALFASQHHQEQVAPFFLQDATTATNSSEGHDLPTMLHLCCKMNAPTDVVLLIHSVCPQSIEMADQMGRLPLHIAAKQGASPYVIRFLIDKNAQAAHVQDVNGMSPLHLACESYMRFYKPVEGDDMSRKEAVEAVVTMLCLASPTTVNAEDKNDMSALEYAIESDLPIRAVKKLQKTSEKQWKKKSMSNVMVEKNSYASPAQQHVSGRMQRRASITPITA